MKIYIENQLKKVEKCIFLYQDYIKKEESQWNQEEINFSNQIMGSLGFFILMLNNYLDTYTNNGSNINDFIFLEIDSLCKTIEENC